MPKLSRLAGSTSHVLIVFAQDSSKTDGSGLTGLAYNTSGLTCYYKRNTAAASVAVTLANIATLGTYAAGGFKEIDATGLPGFYEFHPPDAACAAGAKSVAFLIKGAANLAPVPIEVELTAVDNQDATRLGLTALPNAAATTAGGLPTSGTGNNQIHLVGGVADANTVQVGGQAATIAPDPTVYGSVDASAFTPTTTQFRGNSALSAADNFYSALPSGLAFTSGPLQGKLNKITGYTGSTRLLTFATAWPVAPASGDTFQILGYLG